MFEITSIYDWNWKKKENDIELQENFKFNQEWMFFSFILFASDVTSFWSLNVEWFHFWDNDLVH